MKMEQTSQNRALLRHSKTFKKGSVKIGTKVLNLTQNANWNSTCNLQNQVPTGAKWNKQVKRDKEHLLEAQKLLQKG